MENFYAKNVLVIGEGVSGKGARKALKESGANLIDRNADSIDLIVVSPGVPPEDEIFSFAATRGIKLIGELELGYLICHAPVIAVTGTNGKTTVTSLTGEILARGGYTPLVCGNIGISFAAAAMDNQYDIAVVEVSSFQLETIDKFHPDIAVITNITPDHLDRHGSFEHYCEIKRRIALNQTEDDFLLMPSDLFLPKSRVILVGEKGDCRLDGDDIVFMDKKLLNKSEIKLPGRHNLYNVMNAACAATLCGISGDTIAAAVSNYRPKRHRVEFVAEKHGKRYYDDAKGTNIGAVLSAVACMEGSVCLILGGSDKGYGFEELLDKLPPSVIEIVAEGETKDKIAAACRKKNFLRVSICNDLAQAVKKAAAGDAACVLLSPGVASFDSYTGYEQKGEHFVKLVGEL